MGHKRKVLWIHIGSLSGTETRLPLQLLPGHGWGTSTYITFVEAKDTMSGVRNGNRAGSRQADTEDRCLGDKAEESKRAARRGRGGWLRGGRPGSQRPASPTCPPCRAHHPATRRAATGRPDRVLGSSQTLHSTQWHQTSLRLNIQRQF